MGLKNVSKIDTNRVELEVEVGAEPLRRLSKGHIRGMLDSQFRGSARKGAKTAD